MSTPRYSAAAGFVLTFTRFVASSEVMILFAWSRKPARFKTAIKILTIPSLAAALLAACSGEESQGLGEGMQRTGAPRLQFEFATQGDRTADYIGGWHGTKYGFVLASDAPYSNGIALTPVSTVGGIQYTSRFMITQVGSNWWVGHNGNWLGYYDGYRFDMLNSYGRQAHWYGEVYDPTPTDWRNVQRRATAATTARKPEDPVRTSLDGDRARLTLRRG